MQKKYAKFLKFKLDDLERKGTIRNCFTKTKKSELQTFLFYFINYFVYLR